MNRIYLALAVTLACTTVHAQRDYLGQRDSRYERGVDRCVDDHARGQKLSRKQMKKVEEQCSRASERAPVYSRGREPIRLSPAEVARQRSVSPDQTAP